MIKIDYDFAKSLLPKRKEEANKFDCGKALLICGSRRYIGAPFFAASACVNSGCGLTYLSIPKKILPILGAKLSEPIFLSRFRLKLNNYNAVLIGCGLGRGYRAKKLTYRVVEKAECPVVIDADALYFLSKNPELLKKAKGIRVLTPHAGEFARFGFASPLEFAKRFNCILVLKGAPTRIYLPSGKTYENTTGNCGMAKGGSGDVLAGVIVALLAQGLTAEEASVAGVYFHGLSGDMARDEFGTLGMTPTDTLKFLKHSLK